MRLTIFIFLILFLSDVFCQAPDKKGLYNHLQPIEKIKLKKDYKKSDDKNGNQLRYINYHIDLNNKLSKDFNDKRTVIRYIVKPSWDSEYAYSIETKNDKYILKYNKLSTNLWFAKKNKNKIKVNQVTRYIDKDIVSAMYDLFKTAILTIKDDNFQLLDGICYQFGLYDIENKKFIFGQTSSPPDSTLMRKLVIVSGKLISLSDTSNKANFIFETQRITGLLKQNK